MNQSKEAQKTKLFICGIIDNNLEDIADCTTWEKQCLLKSIVNDHIPWSEIPKRLSDMIQQISNKNIQNYELWMFSTRDGISEQYLREAAKDDLGEFLSLVKENGNMIYHKG